MNKDISNGWYVVITTENKPIIKEWWDKNRFGERAWNIGSYYGIDSDKNPQSNRLRSNVTGIKLTLEEFQILILNQPKPDPIYEIY